MIDPINHYSLTNPASIYDEEAMTALELAGRLASKMNQTITEFNRLESRLLEAIKNNVSEWLEANPEGYATVNNYVTPQMFGAVGDGVADDAPAIQTALNTGSNVFFPAGTYAVKSKELTIPAGVIVSGEGTRTVIINDNGKRA